MLSDNQLYLDFISKVNRFDFKELLEQNEGIEQEVIDGIYTICANVLESGGAKNQNELFVFSDKKFINLKLDFDNVERCLTVYFLLSDGSKLGEASKSHSLFGAIKKVLIKSPELLKSKMQILFERISNFLNQCYSFLEKAYVTKFVEWNQKRKKILLNGIYELIETEIERNNNPKFKNKIWLAVSELDNKNGDTAKFIFEFNDIFLKDFIKNLKKESTLEFSPFIIVSHLISKTINDEQTSKYKEGQLTFKESLDELEIRLDTETYIFWLAEKLLYSEKGKVGMGVHTIAQCGRFLLSTDHSAYNQDLTIKIIEPIKDKIKEIFEQNVVDYKMNPISKLTIKFKYGAIAQNKIISYGGKIKDVMTEKMIEQALWEPLKDFAIKIFTGH